MVWIVGDHVRKLYIERVKLAFLVALSPFSTIRTEGWFVLALRRRLDADEDDAHFAEVDQTPRPTTRPITQPTFDPNRPVVLVGASHSHLQSLGSRTHSTGSGLSPTRKKRSTSPVKRTQDLLAMSKPIKMQSVSNREEQLPAEMLELCSRVEDITLLESPVVPPEARAALQQEIGKNRRLPPHWFLEEDTTTASEERRMAAAAAVYAELASLQKLKRVAKQCEEEAGSESDWTTCVYSNMLELATAGSKVQLVDITTARVAPEWQSTITSTLPGSSSASSASSASRRPYVTDDGGAAVVVTKMVDLALVLDEDEHTPLGSAIQDAIGSAPAGEKSINQSTYGRIALRPLGVAIETNARSDVEGGRVQLALWTAAWFARMQAWVARKPTEGMPLGLPVILVCGHSWELSFVCDRGEKLDFIHGFPIGGTKNLVGMYRLLAVLRVLVEWMDTKFRSFFNKLLDIV
ncbi:hypothetical protein PgNI_06455 [Pyricularia grisea]|uniref:PD-(D/E)XK nuclease-like domain-containing protein n=1 Tax=Pyricularia grisea TaxID=148305 RepID=A0A6P8B7N2_PYRGI|nr:hypothetical protein PgNI_06455 [Pyricularia grisea]TLD11285.1 hypothetical protein PgNI_06455 [Pyricularia grisea]